MSKKNRNPLARWPNKQWNYPVLNKQRRPKKTFGGALTAVLINCVSNVEGAVVKRITLLIFGRSN